MSPQSLTGGFSFLKELGTNVKFLTPNLRASNSSPIKEKPPPGRMEMVANNENLPTSLSCSIASFTSVSVGGTDRSLSRNLCSNNRKKESAITLVSTASLPKARIPFLSIFAVLTAYLLSLALCRGPLKRSSLKDQIKSGMLVFLYTQ